MEVSHVLTAAEKPATVDERARLMLRRSDRFRDRSLMPIEGKPVDDARLAMPRRLTGLSDHA
jgi:hypothetical protein